VRQRKPDGVAFPPNPDPDATAPVLVAISPVAADPRPLVMEHLEDLRGRPRTLVELRRCMERRLGESVRRRDLGRQTAARVAAKGGAGFVYAGRPERPVHEERGLLKLP
jgi:hypothetical protein